MTLRASGDYRTMRDLAEWLGDRGLPYTLERSKSGVYHLRSGTQPVEPKDRPSFSFTGI